MKWKSFAMGFLSAVLIFTTVSVFADSYQKTLTVTVGGVRVFIDGKLPPGKDSNGSYMPVPFIYNGTVYVPAKGVAASLHKPIKWVESTKSVYIGDKTALNRKDFDQIKLGMTPDEVEAIVGADTKPIGSGVTRYGYELEDGTLMMLTFNQIVNHVEHLTEMGLRSLEGSYKVILN